MKITNEQAIEETQALIDRAMSGVHAPAEQIQNLQELWAAYELLSATKKVAAAFNGIKKELFAKYIHSNIQARQTSAELLLLARSMEICEQFYKEEIRILKQDTLKEYWDYFWEGHILEAIFGRGIEK